VKISETRAFHDDSGVAGYLRLQGFADDSMKNLAFSLCAAARLFPVGARRDSLRVAGVIDAAQPHSNAG
jgi:hypothetical protein